MPFYPGLGVGGHCIPVNPYYLFQNGNLPVLKFSTEMMEHRPKKKAYELIKKYKPQRVLICGIGFKKGESLLTNSPGYNLYKQLSKLNIKTEVFDYCVQKVYTNDDISFLSQKEFTPEKLKQKYDLVVVNLPLEKQQRPLLEFYKNLGGKVHDFTV
jgi:UDP-N-acetyl-D-mannosaminuronate dehydrogenase